MRTFISINIPEEIRKEIKKIQDFLPEFSGKKTELQNLHLTLKFLGEIEEQVVGEVKEKLREIKIEKFATEIDKIGVFDNRKSGKYSRKIILWLHLMNCEELQRQVDGVLKDLFEPEKRFMSHLTIARIKGIKDKEEFLQDLKKIKIEKIKFKVDKFYLMKSELTAEGPRYSVLEEYNLN
jgi:2'-5' RNA ligase